MLFIISIQFVGLEGNSYIRFFKKIKSGVIEFPSGSGGGMNHSFFVDNREVTRYIPWLSSWFARAGITQW